MLGDVLHTLDELRAAALVNVENRSATLTRRHGADYVREGVKAVQMAWSRGLWTWMVHGRLAAGYIFIEEEDVVCKME